MPGLQVVFHRLAADEYSSARKWYAERSHVADAHFRDAVDAAVERVTTCHEALPRIGRLYRWVRVRGFPYILITRAQSAEKVMIVAVAHTSRRPGYWRQRRWEQ